MSGRRVAIGSLGLVCHRILRRAPASCAQSAARSAIHLGRTSLRSSFQVVPRRHKGATLDFKWPRPIFFGGWRRAWAGFDDCRGGRGGRVFELEIGPKMKSFIVVAPPKAARCLLVLTELNSFRASRTLTQSSAKVQALRMSICRTARITCEPFDPFFCFPLPFHSTQRTPTHSNHYPCTAPDKEKPRFR